MRVLVEKSSVSGRIAIPGSKSHTLRAVFIAAMAEGESIIHNPLCSLDCYSAASIAQSFGARCCLNSADGAWHILGMAGKLKVPEDILDCGNSGGTTYMTTAIAAAISGCCVVTGDEQIRRRPIKSLLNALNELGASAFTTRDTIDAAPVVIKGPAKGGVCHFDGLLSSHITGVLLAAPLLQENTRIKIEDPHEIPYLEITLDWLRRHGIQYRNDAKFNWIEVSGRQKYQSVNCTIPGDWSSAAFPIIAAIISGSELTVDNLDFSDTQGDKKIVESLEQMGAKLARDEKSFCLHVLPGTQLLGGQIINLAAIPDTLPALAVAAAYANGTTVFKGIENVRLKETDRVLVMEQELSKMGITVTSDKESMTIIGGNPHGAQVDAHGDHRVAMALIAAGMAADGTTIVENSDCISISYPSFLSDMQKIGAKLNADI